MVLILLYNEVFFWDFSQIGLSPYCKAIKQNQSNQISLHLGGTQKEGILVKSMLAL